MTEQTPLDRAREDLVLIAAGARTVTADLLAEPIRRLEQALRDEIANDVNRADRPTFAATQNSELVVKTTRAIDIRLIELSSQAPYWVPRASTSRPEASTPSTDGIPSAAPGCAEWRRSNGRADLCASPTCGRCQQLRTT